MNTSEATAETLPLDERLTAVVRTALLSEQQGTTVEQIVAGILAELCPPNHILLAAEVTHEHDAGMDTPNAWEPAYEYASITGFEVLHDTVEDRSAAFLAFAAEAGDMIPDGMGDLERELGVRFNPQQEAHLRNAAPKPFLVFTNTTEERSAA